MMINELAEDMTMKASEKKNVRYRKLKRYRI